MEKILVNVLAPAIDASYDVLLSPGEPIGVLLPLLIDGIEELSRKQLICTGFEQMSLRDRGAPLDPEKCLEDYRIGQGSKLVIV